MLNGLSLFRLYGVSGICSLFGSRLLFFSGGLLSDRLLLDRSFLGSSFNLSLSLHLHGKRVAGHVVGSDLVLAVLLGLESLVTKSHRLQGVALLGSGGKGEGLM